MKYETFKRRFLEEVVPPEEQGNEDNANYLEHGWVKYKIAALLKPARITEIGVKSGYSAWCLIQGANIPRQHFVGYDNFEVGYNGWHDRSVHKANAKRLLEESLVEADSHSLATVEAAELYHIDGDHSARGARQDMDLCRRSSPGAILVDDYNDGSVRHAVASFLSEHPEYMLLQMESWRGEALLFLD